MSCKRHFLLLLLWGVWGCTTGMPPSTSAPPPSPAISGPTIPEADLASGTETTAAVLVRKSYEESDATLLNPERGWFYWTDFLEDDFANARALGYSLIYARVMLRPYVNKPLDEKLLLSLAAAFQKARQAGVKCILRFSYSDSHDTVTDAPLATILYHISQLKPLFTANADVIYVLQAGFIGRWGEWHSSSNGLDADPNARKQILDALLNALPQLRHIQVRSPLFKESYAALGGKEGTRIGHHNDCFLASLTDFGTYPDDAVDLWKGRVAADGLVTPVGGETCKLNPPRSDCGPAQQEMAALHFNFLNGSTVDGVTKTWKKAGCYDAIGRHLGYRFALTTAEFNDRVRPGSTLHVKLTIRNSGYAVLSYPRTAYLTLTGPTSYTAKVPLDLTQIKPGADITMESNITLPAQAAEGVYLLSLWMPDPAPSLRANFVYDIVLANSGGNLVSDAIMVSPLADPYTVPSDTAFEAK